MSSRTCNQKHLAAVCRSYSKKSCDHVNHSYIIRYVDALIPTYIGVSHYWWYWIGIISLIV